MLIRVCGQCSNHTFNIVDTKHLQFKEDLKDNAASKLRKEDQFLVVVQDR